MKLYLDENISPRIADALSGLGVRDIGHVGTVFPDARRAGRVVEDEEWIAAVGEGGCSRPRETGESSRVLRRSLRSSGIGPA